MGWMGWLMGGNNRVIHRQTTKKTMLKLTVILTTSLKVNIIYYKYTTCGHNIYNFDSGNKQQ